MNETEFWGGFELTSKEINLAIESFYTWLEIHNYAMANKEIYSLLNKTPSFWNINLYGLQASYFLALGRIFDTGKDSHSIHKFIKSCIDHPEHFSREALEKRKQGDSEKPDWLDNFMKETYLPQISDFGKIKKEISLHRNKFDEIYRDIRNCVFAHNIANNPGATAEMFGKTKIADIEEMLYFLHDLQGVVFNLFYNGVKPDLGKKEYSYKERISSEVRQAINILDARTKGNNA